MSRGTCHDGFGSAAAARHAGLWRDAGAGAGAGPALPVLSRRPAILDAVGIFLAGISRLRPNADLVLARRERAARRAAPRNKTTNTKQNKQHQQQKQTTDPKRQKHPAHVL